MRVLLISASPIKREVSIGNTFLDLFADQQEVQLASIYTRNGLPDGRVERAFLVSDRMLIGNLLKNSSVGKEVTERANAEQTARENKEKQKDSIGAFLKKKRWTIFYWIQNLIWRCAKWKNTQLENFVRDFDPDIIFTVFADSAYLNRLILHVHKISGAPLAVYAWDDNYSYRSAEKTPFGLLYKAGNRRVMRKIMDAANTFFAISRIQKEEYQEIFCKPFKVLTKSADFSADPPVVELPKDKVKLLYAGNLGAGRWESLALIAEAVEALNKEGYAVSLDTYSATPQTKAMQKALMREGCTLNGAVPFAQVQQLQQEADILIHVEGLSLKSRWMVHQSFSTKLVDYFALGKCIFAVGTPDVASVDHLIRNDAAVVADKTEDVYAKLKDLLNQPEQLAVYGRNAYLCGRKHHNQETMQKMLIDDLNRVIETGDRAAKA